MKVMAVSSGHSVRAMKHTPALVTAWRGHRQCQPIELLLPKSLFTGLALGEHQLHFSTRLKHGELHQLLAGLCSGRLLRGQCFGGISCISVYLCFSFRVVLQHKTRLVWNRDPSCAPHHCSVLCFVHKISKVGNYPKFSPAATRITMFRRSPTLNRKQANKQTKKSL